VNAAALRAGLKTVASAILADVEPGLPARRNRVATGKTIGGFERSIIRTVFPGGGTPPSTAGKDARRHIFRQALKHLSAVDPVMRRLIRTVGWCELAPETRRSPFQSLVQGVAHQQLNGTAAGNILARFKKLFPGRRFPRPEDLAKVTDEQIRVSCRPALMRVQM
jgi:hypothetical protein